MPGSRPARELASPLDLRAIWLGEVNRIAAQQRWGRMLFALAGLHLVAMIGCQVASLRVGATVKWIYPAIWVSEVYLTFVIARWFAGKGWAYASAMTSVVFRVWVTYLILCFSVASLNTLSGFEHDWFKPVWCTLGTFGFATMAWLISFWFLVPAVQLYFTGLLMVQLPAYNFLIHGLSFGLALCGIGLVLERKRLARLALQAGTPAQARLSEPDPSRQPAATHRG